VKAAGPRARLGQDAPDHLLGRDHIGQLELDVHQLFTHVLGLPRRADDLSRLPPALAPLTAGGRNDTLLVENRDVSRGLLVARNDREASIRSPAVK
jgi:hypothetical protein